MSNDISGPATPENEHLGDNDVVIHIYTRFGDVYRTKYQTREDLSNHPVIIRQAANVIENDWQRARILGQ